MCSLMYAISFFISCISLSISETLASSINYHLSFLSYTYKNFLFG
jgi:hypothetical protein